MIWTDVWLGVLANIPDKVNGVDAAQRPCGRKPSDWQERDRMAELLRGDSVRCSRRPTN